MRSGGLQAAPGCWPSAGAGLPPPPTTPGRHVLLLHRVLALARRETEAAVAEGSELDN